MNTYVRNMIAIIIIVVICFIFFGYWAEVDFGLAYMFLIIAGGYGLYLNLTALYKRTLN